MTRRTAAALALVALTATTAACGTGDPAASTTAPTTTPPATTTTTPSPSPTTATATATATTLPLEQDAPATFLGGTPTLTLQYLVSSWKQVEPPDDYSLGFVNAELDCRLLVTTLPSAPRSSDAVGTQGRISARSGDLNQPPAFSGTTQVHLLDDPDSTVTFALASHDRTVDGLGPAREHMVVRHFSASRRTLEALLICPLRSASPASDWPMSLPLRLGTPPGAAS